MKRFLFGLLLISVAAAAGLGLLWKRAERREAATVEWTRFVMDSLGTSIRLPTPPEGTARDSVYWQWVATSAQLQSRQWERTVRQRALSHSVLLDESELAQLRQDGLSDPVRQLRESLKAQQDLIPEAPTPGLTMIFVPGEHIVLLGRPYVFAEYTDGQIHGYMLAEYTIDPAGAITWKRLWSVAT